jgi:ribosomal protein S27AE
VETKFPLPKVRQQITITQANGYNRACPKCGPGRGWAQHPREGECVFQPNDNGVACGHPFTVDDWTPCNPRIITGKVTRLGKSVTGAPLVYLKQTGERAADIIVWGEVLAVEVHS